MLILIHNNQLTHCRGDGGATMTEPVGGFAQAAMSTMFNPPKSSPSTTVPTTAVPSTKSPGDSGPSSATIAGAVVGSVAGFIIIAALAIFFLRKKKKKPSPEPVRHELTGEFQTEELDSKSPKQELPAEIPIMELPGDDVFAELEANETTEGKDLGREHSFLAQNNKDLERGDD